MNVAPAMKKILSVLFTLFYVLAQGNIRIGFGGDVMIGRLVNDVLKQKGMRYPWGNIVPILEKNDINIINLETTLTKSNAAVPKVFNFKSDPEHVQTLKEAFIHVVTLANNHSLDFGVQGLKDTLKALDSAGILHIGAGMSLAEAQKPIIIEKNGIKIGIIGATDNEPDWKAERNKPGINYFEVCKIESLQKLIQEIKKQVDILILSLHWGPNMRQRPTKDYIDCAHAFIEAGVDIVHGHSAHIFQGIEKYKNKLILYDTGDFVDDYAIDPVLRNDQSCLFIVEINKQGIKQVRCIPTKIDMMQVNQAQGKEAKEIIGRLQKLSAEFGTNIDDKGIINFSL
jgi:poly-gamma-glutamate synthesis protein (capsule biosynthesis protein)